MHRIAPALLVALSGLFPPAPRDAPEDLGVPCAIGIGGAVEETPKLRAHTGGPETASAVDRGLVRLGKLQTADGAWRDVGSLDRAPAATGLGVLVYLGAGESRRHGHYKPNVKEALAFLDGLRSRDGRFGSGADHAIPVLALCEAWALTAAPAFEAPARAGVRVLLDRPDEFLADPDVLLWSAAALKAAKDAKILTEAELDAARDVALKHLPSGARGDLVRVFLGREPAPEPENATLPTEEEARRLDPVEFWVRTLVAWHREGDAWKRWVPLLKGVVDAAPDEGEEPASESFDATVFRTLCAQIYWRYGRTFGTR